MLFGFKSLILIKAEKYFVITDKNASIKAIFSDFLINYPVNYLKAKDILKFGEFSECYF